jgi:hypothetical protein
MTPLSNPLLLIMRPFAQLTLLGLMALAGCSTTFLREDRAVGLQIRFGVDTRVGHLRVERSQAGGATTQSIELSNLESIPREDIAKAVAEGVVEGLIRAGIKP